MNAAAVSRSTGRQATPLYEVTPDVNPRRLNAPGRVAMRASTARVAATGSLATLPRTFPSTPPYQELS